MFKSSIIRLFKCQHLWFLILLLFNTACYYSPRAARKLYDKAAKGEPYDMVVVPGVPFNNGNWDMVMRGRVLWAKYLYDKGVAKNIMFSGGAVYSPYIEAEIMKLYAVALGMPEQHVFTEIRAEHSTENIYYSYKKSQSLGFKKVALASDPFQTNMLKRFVRQKVSPDVALIPFVTEYLRPRDTSEKGPAINYNSALQPGFVSIVDREGFWFRLRGTRGLRLDSTIYSDPKVD